MPAESPDSSGTQPFVIPGIDIELEDSIEIEELSAHCLYAQQLTKEHKVTIGRHMIYAARKISLVYSLCTAEPTATNELLLASAQEAAKDLNAISDAKPLLYDRIKHLGVIEDYYQQNHNLDADGGEAAYAKIRSQRCSLEIQNLGLLRFRTSREGRAVLDTKIERLREEAAASTPDVDTDIDSLLKDIQSALGQEMICSAPSSFRSIPITMNHLYAAAEKIYKVRLSNATAEEETRLGALYDNIRNNVYGQDRNLKPILVHFTDSERAVGRSSGMGSFLLAGPMDTGKTMIGKALAQHGFGSAECCYIIACEKYLGNSADTLVPLTGDPVQHTAGQLTLHVQRFERSIVVFQHLDQGGAAVQDLFKSMIVDNSILDAGTGERVHCRATFIFATAACDRGNLQESAPDSHMFRSHCDDFLESIQAKLPRNITKYFTGVLFFTYLTRDGQLRIVADTVEQEIKLQESRLNLSIRFTDDATVGIGEQVLNVVGNATRPVSVQTRALLADLFRPLAMSDERSKIMGNEINVNCKRNKRDSMGDTRFGTLYYRSADAEPEPV